VELLKMFFGGVFFWGFYLLLLAGETALHDLLKKDL